ncbi:hypothetical protein OROGR_018124 [Orobanche gracilis]
MDIVDNLGFLGLGPGRDKHKKNPTPLLGSHRRLMGSSAFIRRWISSRGSAGLFRCRRIPGEGAKRFMSTATTGGVSSPSAPWLMLPPAVDGSGNISYKFHCLATKSDFVRTNNVGRELSADDIQFVGSSHGWLALYNPRNSNLFLSDPITDRHINLPSPRGLGGGADRVILTSSPIEEGALALMTFGSSRCRLALCSPRRGGEWSLFGGDREYDNLVYSSRSKRIFTIVEEYDYDEEEDEDELGKKQTSLEGWDVGGSKPRLDCVILCKKEIDFNDHHFDWPAMPDLKKECTQVKYLVSDESSGDLYLVVRHVNPRAGPLNSLTDKIVISPLRGVHFIRTPYKTIEFDVYKVDFECGEVVYMEDSLDGLAIFVGINHSFAIPAAEVSGVKADSIYFTDENRLIAAMRFERTTYGGHDNGIFDYRNKVFHSCCDFYPVEYEKIRKILPLPLWFTPPATTAVECNFSSFECNLAQSSSNIEMQRGNYVF